MLPIPWVHPNFAENQEITALWIFEQAVINYD
jgi:hypothetical protein